MPTTNSDLLTTAAAAEYLGLREQTLSVWRCTGRYQLPFLRVGSRVKYRRADLDRWLESRAVTVQTADAK